MRRNTGFLRLAIAAVAQTALASAALQAAGGGGKDWWDKAWTGRQQVVIDPAAGGKPIEGELQPGAALIRLHAGNFDFGATAADGSDLRVINGADNSEVAHHLEKFDALFGEAFLWVSTPERGGEDSPAELWVYFGAEAAGGSAANMAGTYDEKALAVFHFAETSGNPKDWSGKGNNATAAPIPIEGSLIGNGARLDEAARLEVPASESLTWAEGADFTWSLWVKSADNTGERILMQYGEVADGLRLGTSEGVPHIEIAGDGGQKASASSPLAAATWQHLALVSSGGSLTLYVDGVEAARLAAPAPALPVEGGSLVLGKREGQEAASFSGEIDEMQLWSVARPVSAILFDALVQGPTEAAAQIVAVTEAEVGGGHGEALEHVMLFGDIAKNMMFDGWIAVGVCIIMIIFGWTVAVQKFNYLNSIQKGSEAFLQLWHQVSSDLTVLDQKDENGEQTFGGKLTPKLRYLLKHSPIYHLYHIGSEEISHRLKDNPKKGLSARAIQAIRASLETGLVRENQRMNKGLIFLTTSIAGGPYVGLLGTVVGVMITFALIAKTGEVDVNSIAPGIASALLATVAGLVVAIPALFIYSYLNTRIRDLLASMQVFIDEFIAKMAEFYPTPEEASTQLVKGPFLNSPPKVESLDLPHPTEKPQAPQPGRE